MATAVIEEVENVLALSDATEGTVDNVPVQTADTDHPEGAVIRRQVRS
jgi:hypothetical protein